MQKRQEKPADWPEGLWFSKDDNAALYDDAVHLSKTDPKYHNYNGNVELQKQVALRIQHADLIAKSEKKTRNSQKKEARSPSSMLIYSLFNATNAEVQKQRRFLEDNCNTEDAKYKSVEAATRIAEAYDLFKDALIGQESLAVDEEGRPDYMRHILQAAKVLGTAAFDTKDDLQYVKEKLIKSADHRKRSAEKQREKKATPIPKKK